MSSDRTVIVVGDAWRQDDTARRHDDRSGHGGRWTKGLENQYEEDGTEEQDRGKHALNLYVSTIFFFRGDKQRTQMSILDLAWTLFPTTAKVGFTIYYVAKNARKTYETVAFLSEFIPSREPRMVHEQTPWVWVTEPKEDYFEYEQVVTK